LPGEGDGEDEMGRGGREVTRDEEELVAVTPKDFKSRLDIVDE
jgi:hypothetical protein